MSAFASDSGPWYACLVRADFLRDFPGQEDRADEIGLLETRGDVYSYAYRSPHRVEVGFRVPKGITYTDASSGTLRVKCFHAPDNASYCQRRPACTSCHIANIGTIVRKTMDATGGREVVYVSIDID
jgi:hypothetical protein